MKAWQRIDDGTDVSKVGFRTIVTKRFRMNSGKEMNAYIADVKDNAAAGVVALDTNNQVVIARQFRCGPEMVMDEIPGGLIDNGEAPEDAAKRELREETGYEYGTFTYLGKVYVNGWSNTLHHYFLARDCKKVSDTLELDENEEVEVVTIPIDMLLKNAKSGKMTDAQGVLLAYDTLKSIQERGL